VRKFSHENEPAQEEESHDSTPEKAPSAPPPALIGNK